MSEVIGWLLAVVALALVGAVLDAAVATWLLSDIFPRLHFGEWFRIMVVVSFVFSWSSLKAS